jgi:hypothetical protein
MRRDLQAFLLSPGRVFRNGGAGTGGVVGGARLLLKLAESQVVEEAVNRRL